MLAGAGGGEGFGSRYRWELNFSPVGLLWLPDLWFLSIVSEKQLSVLLNKIKPF